MQFQVNSIQFDFDDEDLTNDEKIDIVDDNLGMWEADDEDDLIEEITCASGWCIKSIDYDHILNWINAFSRTIRARLWTTHTPTFLLVCCIEALHEFV